MLKISAGNEEFGLCGKWLLHGFKIAKLNFQGNPRLMQESFYFTHKLFDGICVFR